MRAKILIDQGKHGNDNHRGHLLTKNELEILCSDTIFENAISQQEISKLILDQKKANLLHNLKIIEFESSSISLEMLTILWLETELRAKKQHKMT